LAANWCGKKLLMRIFPARFRAMSDLRGRPLYYVALTLVAWVGGRLAWESDWQFHLPPAEKIADRAATLPAPSLQKESVYTTAHKRTQGAITLPRLPTQRSTSFRPPPAMDPWQDGGWPSGLPSSALVAGGGEPMSPGRDTPPTNARAPAGKAGPPEFNRRRWGGDVYAYSFWRMGSGNGSALAPGAQYGGSQSGVIATLDPFGEPDRGLALLLRGSATPDWQEREVALGLRWRPDSGWPLSLAAERRFNMNGPDRFATYLAGGFDNLRLKGKLKASAFGQAGYVTGRGGGGFFDAQARVMHPLIKVAGVPVGIGAGSWAGGQKGAFRLDGGPTLEAQVETSLAKFRLQIDWRQKLAGNALPESGVALTVSTGF
jgi:hypothetical protein